MSLEFVLDSSVTMAWLLLDQATSSTDELLDQLNADARALVPAHWALEVSNTLLVAERRKRCTVADSSHFLAILTALPIEMDRETAARAFGTNVALARAQGLTSYDGAYLDLAMRRSLALATLDKDLRSAARRTGVPLLPKNL